MNCDDSDDESDQEIISKDNAEKSTTNKTHNSLSVERQGASSVERQTTSSIGRQNLTSVEPSIGVESQYRSHTERTPTSSQRSTNSGGVSSNQNSVTHQDNYEASSSRANLPQQRKWTRDHPFELIIGDASQQCKLGKQLKKNVYTTTFSPRKSQGS